MSRLKIEELSEIGNYEITGSRVALHCVYGEHRYHFWVAVEHPGPLGIEVYKNPKTRIVGDTRQPVVLTRLRGMGREIFEAMQPLIPELVAKAIEQQQKRLEQEKEVRHRPHILSPSKPL